MTKKKAVTVIEPKTAVRNRYDRLWELIREYVDYSVTNSWSGGGDPADVEVLEAREQLAKAELGQHIQIMERDDRDRD